MTDLASRRYALEEYKLAVKVMLNENNLFWNRLHVFLLVNSGLFVAIGIWPTGEQLWNLAVAIVGIIVCIAWFLILAKAKSIQDYVNDVIQQVLPDTGFHLMLRAEYEAFMKRKPSYARQRNLKIALFVPLAFLGAWILRIAILVITAIN